MLGHLGLNVPDIEVARSYYSEILPLVDYQPYVSDEEGFAYMPASGHRGAYLFFYTARQPGAYSREQSGLQHLAFIVPNRTAVRLVHHRAVALGSEVLHLPREFPQYPPPYFATFWLDPFGFMLEAVCHHDRD